MRFRRTSHLWIALLVILLLVTGIQAHVPLIGGDNEALETATYIDDPLKSWAIYGELRDAAVVNYYRFDMEQGQRLRLMLFTPEEELFTPGLVIMGPRIEPQGTVPSIVTVPQGAGAMVVEGKRPERASYEPFTPASQFELVDIDLNVLASGTYYVAVYEPLQGGPYGLALGYKEEFSLVEWIRVPLDVIRIHQWEGQSLAFILAPLLAVLACGFSLLFWQRKKGASVPQNTFGWIGSFISFLYLGSGAIMFTQMAIALTRTTLSPAVIVTIIFALLPVIAGVIMVRVALSVQGKIETKARLKIAILGILGLFIWAGLVIGPVIAVVASLLLYPQKNQT
jgi:hypothetical protein